ncbi:Permeases of the drug/metabolite transporter {DMT} superfamily [Geoglobus ahangari]|uniref:Permeases of the drug/metabolite transporter (DMT) superfamily n=1 Tax=Geoglobus ahangari TaxID=113653 RepID=A0A0F7IFE6_9EURY|nr:EamA family transporter [Geoglobus ahangari]AKG91517.1 Permeases of the drug/metabolite transporter {DMT} superfamily [Geoglobus ahangari]
MGDRLKWVVLFFTILFWGLAFTAIKYAVQSLTPYELAFLRFLVADTLFIATIVHSRYRIERSDLLKVTFIGVFGVAIYHVSLNAGEMFIPSGVASLIIAMSPVFVLIFSAMFLDERITLAKVAGIVIALLGVYVLSHPESGGDLTGILLVLIATLSAGIYTVGGKVLMRKYDPLVLTSYVMVLGSVPLIPFAITSFHSVLRADLLTVLSVVFPTYFSYQGWYYFLNREEASKASVFLQAIPVVSILAGYFLLGEEITYLTVIGGAMVMAGIIIVVRSKS